MRRTPDGVTWLFRLTAGSYEVGAGMLSVPRRLRWTCRVWARNRPVGRVLFLGQRLGLFWIGP